MTSALADRLDELLRHAGTGGLRQPDQRSCGAACLVVARMLLDPSYADLTARAFRPEVLGMHGRVTGPVDARGALQVPWPRALGTPPWAVARQLSSNGANGSRPGRYDARLVLDRDAAHDRLTLSQAPAALYVGNRWLPRHVVLVVEATADRLTCYEPSRGVRVDVERAALVGGRLRLGGWDRPWVTVTT